MRIEKDDAPSNLEADAEVAGAAVAQVGQASESRGNNWSFERCDVSQDV